MANPITWKNVAAPNFGASNALMASSIRGLGDATAGIADSLQGVHDLKSERLTGEGLQQLMALNDPATAGAQAAGILSGIDTRYADMPALATAAQEREADLVKLAADQFDLSKQEEMYDLEKRFKEASIDARNRQYTGASGKGGNRVKGGPLLGGPYGDLSPQDRVLAALMQDPDYQELPVDDKRSRFMSEVQRLQLGSKGANYAFDNIFGPQFEEAEKIREGDRKKKSSYKPAKLITADPDMDAPTWSWDKDLDAQSDYNILAKYLQRDLKLSPTDAAAVLKEGFDFIGSGWEWDDPDLIKAIRRAEMKYKSSSAGEDDPVTETIKQLRR